MWDLWSRESQYSRIYGALCRLDLYDSQREAQAAAWRRPLPPPPDRGVINVGPPKKESEKSNQRSRMCLSPLMSRWLNISVGKHVVISLHAPKKHLKETSVEGTKKKRKKNLITIQETQEYLRSINLSIITTITAPTGLLELHVDCFWERCGGWGSVFVWLWHLFLRCHASSHHHAGPGFKVERV